MMKPARFIRRARAEIHSRLQAGDELLGALIGVALTAVIGLGLSYAAARLLVSQRYVTTQSAVLAQMTNAMSTTGIPTLCAGATAVNVSVGTATLVLPAPTCANAPVGVAVTGGAASLAVTLPAGVVTSMSFSTPDNNPTAMELLGGNGVVTISQ